jgi:hypothetical protein
MDNAKTGKIMMLAVAKILPVVINEMLPIIIPIIMDFFGSSTNV